MLRTKLVAQCAKSDKRDLMSWLFVTCRGSGTRNNSEKSWVTLWTTRPIQKWNLPTFRKATNATTHTATFTVCLNTSYLCREKWAIVKSSEDRWWPDQLNRSSEIILNPATTRASLLANRCYLCAVWSGAVAFWSFAENDQDDSLRVRRSRCRRTAERDELKPTAALTALAPQSPVGINLFTALRWAFFYLINPAIKCGHEQSMLAYFNVKIPWILFSVIVYQRK